MTQSYPFPLGQVGTLWDKKAPTRRQGPDAYTTRKKAIYFGWYGIIISNPPMQPVREAIFRKYRTLNVDDKTLAALEGEALEELRRELKTFHVLLDLDNAVIGQYKVDGIPTKFVVDPAGRIRFRSAGFDGKPDKLVDELSLMIGLAAEAGAGDGVD